ncbi:MAG: lipoyl(octanoyl) transferase LipB [Flavobacteriales bacterium]|nr:lipoyl(octanoyl) transferase LipB [Flavobacteriales bacterium]MDP4952995.1 lipoyl(octanoyl) transferase LipB [Flavobacteriales bacterium]
MNTPTVKYRDLGRIDYKECWDYQEQLFKEIVDQKIFNRNHPEAAKITDNVLLFVEHPPVFTLGKSGVETNLLASDEELNYRGASYYKINRGGDITYHGPGQVVGYPIFDLDHFFTDIHKYLRYLEEAIILTIADYGITGERVDGLTGVWVDGQHPEKARKIAALGVKCSRWVTMHGFALNVNTDLSFFDLIVPCGIDDKAVTSIEKELGAPVDEAEVKAKLLLNLQNVFDFEIA